MYASIPALVFAAVAAASEAQSASLIPRTALSSMKMWESDKLCHNYQKVVCCNKDWECGEVKFYNAYKNDFLYEHCSATVVCCDFDTKIEKSNIWGGYIKNNCINVGTVVVTKEDKKKPYGGGYSTLGEPAAEGAPEAAPEAAPEVVPVEA